MIITCGVCHKGEAIIHKQYGVLPCLECQLRRKQQKSPDQMIEMTTQTIRDQRNEYARSIIQPYRAGQLSREYLDMYGTKNIKPTAKEIKNAKRVWKDTYSDNFNLKKTK